MKNALLLITNENDKVVVCEKYSSYEVAKEVAQNIMETIRLIGTKNIYNFSITELEG